MLLAKVKKAKEQYSLFDKMLKQQQGVIALLLYQVWTVAPLQEKSIETVNHLFIKVFYCIAPDVGSLLHGHVTAISKLVMKKTENHQETGITVHVGFKFGKQFSWQSMKQFQVPGSIPGFPILRKETSKIFSLIDTLQKYRVFCCKKIYFII